MPNCRFALIIALIVLSLGACSVAPPDTPPEKAAGAELFSFVNEEQPYRQWPTLPSVSERLTGTPHGPQTTIYANQLAKTALDENALPLPEGATLVLENRSAAGKLTGLEMMQKRKGFYQRGGDWYWLRFSAAGQVEKEGAMGECIRCHARMRQSDYIYR